jgi:hypothetical protein
MGPRASLTGVLLYNLTTGIEVYDEAAARSIWDSALWVLLQVALVLATAAITLIGAVYWLFFRSGLVLLCALAPLGLILVTVVWREKRFKAFARAAIQ